MLVVHLYDMTLKNFLLSLGRKEPCLDANNNSRQPLEQKFTNSSLQAVVLRRDNTIQQIYIVLTTFHTTRARSNQLTLIDALYLSSPIMDEQDKL